MLYTRRLLVHQSTQAMNHGGRCLESAVRTSLIFVAYLLQNFAEFLLALDTLISRNAEKDHLILAEGGSRLSTHSYVSSSRRHAHSFTAGERKGIDLRAAACEIPESVEEPKDVAAVADSKQEERMHLLNRLIELVKSQQLSLDRVRVLVLAKDMAGSIQSSAESLGLPERVVQPFHAWVCELSGIWKVNIPVTSENPEMRLDAILRYAETHHPEPVLDIALLDEDQNLPPAAYRLLALVSRHVTLFTEKGERLYDCF